MPQESTDTPLRVKLAGQMPHRETSQEQGLTPPDKVHTECARRKPIRAAFPTPKWVLLKPHLDDFLVTVATKSTKKELAKIQIFVLDTVAPLTVMLGQMP